MWKLSRSYMPICTRAPEARSSCLMTTITACISYKSKLCIGFFIGTFSVIILFVSRGIRASDSLLCHEQIFARGRMQRWWYIRLRSGLEVQSLFLLCEGFLCPVNHAGFNLRACMPTCALTRWLRLDCLFASASHTSHLNTETLKIANSSSSTTKLDLLQGTKPTPFSS